MTAPALLALADGRVFRGEACGAPGEGAGEVVFNTSMTGYQEILTDPSYRGQIVCMTYPLIGNYGINPEDVESRRPWVSGFIVKEACPFPSNWRGRMKLDDYMKEHGIVGIQGIDTRALTRHLRDHGAQEGLISTVETDPGALVEKARRLPGLIGRDLVSEVTVAEPHGWTEGEWDLRRGYLTPPTPGFTVAAFDSGIKRNILRCLAGLGCGVEVLPAGTPAAAVLERKPDGIFLSNGPGDPAATGVYAVPEIKKLVGSGLPLFGICLGHQMLGIALGGTTAKMHQGHHGANHPVKDFTTGKVEITSMNHGFAVDRASLPETVEETHVSLFDGSNCGLKVKDKPVFSVQYHPEASPGPQDSHYLFTRFVALMAERKVRSGAGG